MPAQELEPSQWQQLVVEMPNEDVQDRPSESEGLLDEQSDAWNAAELIEAVHRGIDWLHRLSNMVRRASLFSQNRRANNFKWTVEQETPSEVETQRMIDFLKKQYFRFLSDSSAKGSAAAIAYFGAEPSQDPDPGPDPLTERVVETMIIRHKRVLYRRSRHRHRPSRALEQVLPPPMELQAIPEERSQSPPAKKVQTSGGQPDDTATEHRVRKYETAAPTSERSGATSVNQSFLRRSLGQSAPSRQLSTASSGQKLPEDWPPAPKKARQGKSFVCSYCCCLLSGREGRGKQWR